GKLFFYDSASLFNDVFEFDFEISSSVRFHGHTDLTRFKMITYILVFLAGLAIFAYGQYIARRKHN
ncbi:MAG: hypothetical protein K2H64_04550, partial [Desulfovibrio sp.]|nr:hypothetical protein [Desulfovibrio sp.]